jgi:hypothetical protein
LIDINALDIGTFKEAWWKLDHMNNIRLSVAIAADLLHDHVDFISVLHVELNKQC